jgi:hypothetical protein
MSTYSQSKLYVTRFYAQTQESIRADSCNTEYGIRQVYILHPRNTWSMHRTTLNGCSTRIVSFNTPLSTDTLYLQKTIQNLHPFRRYRAEWKFRVNATGPRSKVTSPRFHDARIFVLLIHQPCIKQSKICIRLCRRYRSSEREADMPRKT